MHFIFTYLLSTVVPALFITESAPALGGGPLNDHCGTVLPQVLPMGTTLTFSGNTAGATLDGDYVDGSLLAGFGVPVVWHAFTTTACADLELDYCSSPTAFGTSFWELLARGCPAGDDLVFAAHYTLDSCAGANPHAFFPELPAGTYYYPVAAVVSGDYTIQVKASACAGVPPSPANDLCSSLTPVFVAEEDTIVLGGDNTTATAVGDFVAGSPFNSAPVVWHALVLNACVDLTLNYCGQSPTWTSTIGALATSCPGDQMVYFTTTTDTTCADGNTSYTFLSLAAGTYYVPVLADAVNGSIGAYTIEVVSRPCDGTPQVPVNDQCGAVPVMALPPGGDLLFQGNNTNATSTDDFVAGSPFEAAPVVWHAFSTTMCLDVRLSYCGMEPAWSNTLGMLTLECPGDSVVYYSAMETCADGNTEYVFIDLPAGLYHVPVLADAASGSIGAYALAVSATQCLTGTAPGDVCAGAVPADLLDDGPLVFNGDNSAATGLGDFVPGSSLAGAPVNWHAFTTDGCMDVTVAYCGQSPLWNNTLGVLASTCPADVLVGFTSVNATACADGNVTYAFAQLPAGTWYVPVLRDDASGSFGAYEITVSATACVEPPPVNDACGALPAVPLMVGDTTLFTGDNTHATAQGDFAPGSMFAGAVATWHTFTLSTCASVKLSYCAQPGWSNVLGGLATSCPADEMIMADAMDLVRCGGDGVSFRFDELAAGTYHLPILADQASGSIGAYSVEVIVMACAVDVPGNDDCGSLVPIALELDVPATVTGNNIGASFEEGLGVPAVWEAFTLATCSDVRISYCGSVPTFTEVLATLYEACPATTAIATGSQQPGTCGFGDDNLELHYAALPAGTYHVPVRWMPGAAAGEYTLTFTATACTVVPENDDCAAATTVPVHLPEACGEGTAATNVGASAADDGPACGFPVSELKDVWFTFNSGDRTLVDIVVTPGTIEGVGVEVRSACDGTVLACVLGEEVIDLPVTIDTDLLVRVFSYADLGAGGTFTLCVEGVPGTGVHDVTLQGITIRPNPARDAFQLVVDDLADAADLRLFDLTGRQVFAGRQVLVPGVPLTVHRPDGLAAGTYVLQLVTTDRRVEGRVLFE